MDSVSKAKVKPSAKAKAHSQNSLKRIKKKNLARELVTNSKNGSSHTSNSSPPPVPEKRSERSDHRGHHQLQHRSSSREKETDPETEEEIYQSRKLMIRQIQVSCQINL